MKYAAALTLHESTTRSELRNLEPNGFEEGEPTLFKGEKDFPEFSVKNVCLAVELGDRNS